MDKLRKYTKEEIDAAKTEAMRIKAVEVRKRLVEEENQHSRIIATELIATVDTKHPKDNIPLDKLMADLKNLQDMGANTYDLEVDYDRGWNDDIEIKGVIIRGYKTGYIEEDDMEKHFDKLAMAHYDTTMAGYNTAEEMIRHNRRIDEYLTLKRQFEP